MEEARLILFAWNGKTIVAKRNADGTIVEAIEVRHIMTVQGPGISSDQIGNFNPSFTPDVFTFLPDATKSDYTRNYNKCTTGVDVLEGVSQAKNLIDINKHRR